MKYVKNKNTGETAEVVGKTSEGVTVKKRNGQYDNWANNKLAASAFKAAADKGSTSVSERDNPITWEYNTFGHVEIWKGDERVGESDLYLQIDTDVDSFFEHIGLDPDDVSPGDHDTTEDPGYFDFVPTIELQFKTPIDRSEDMVAGLQLQGYDAGTDAFYEDPDNYVTVIVRTHSERKADDIRDLATRVYNSVEKTETAPDSAFTDAFKTAVEMKGSEEAVDFASNVGSFIKRCLEDGGTPVFKTRYAGERYDNNLVLGQCYGGRGAVTGVYFSNVPTDIIDKMEAGSGDWKWIQQMYTA